MFTPFNLNFNVHHGAGKSIEGTSNDNIDVVSATKGGHDSGDAGAPSCDECQAADVHSYADIVAGSGRRGGDRFENKYRQRRIRKWLEEASEESHCGDARPAFRLEREKGVDSRPEPNFNLALLQSWTLAVITNTRIQSKGMLRFSRERDRRYARCKSGRSEY